MLCSSVHSEIPRVAYHRHSGCQAHTSCNKNRRVRKSRIVLVCWNDDCLSQYRDACVFVYLSYIVYISTFDHCAPPKLNRKMQIGSERERERERRRMLIITINIDYDVADNCEQSKWRRRRCRCPCHSSRYAPWIFSAQRLVMQNIQNPNHTSIKLHRTTNR